MNIGSRARVNFLLLSLTITAALHCSSPKLKPTCTPTTFSGMVSVVLGSKNISSSSSSVMVLEVMVAVALALVDDLALMRGRVTSTVGEAVGEAVNGKGSKLKQHSV